MIVMKSILTQFFLFINLFKVSSSLFPLFAALLELLECFLEGMEKSWTSFCMSWLALGMSNVFIFGSLLKYNTVTLLVWMWITVEIFYILEINYCPTLFAKCKKLIFLALKCREKNIFNLYNFANHMHTFNWTQKIISYYW